MIAVGLALLTFLGWGSGDVIGAITSRRIGALRASLTVSGGMCLVVALLAPFMSTTHLHMDAILQSAGLGLFLSVAYLAFVEALRIGNPALVGTISGSFTALSVVLSLAFLHESLSTPQLLFIGVIVIGVIGASLDIRTLRERAVRLDRSIVLSFVTLVGWGVYFTFMKVPIREAGWYWPTLISSISGTLLYVVCYAFHKQKPKEVAWKTGVTPAFFTAIIGGGANVTYNIALSYGNVSVVSPIAGSYLVLFVVLASRVFKEPLNRQQTAGIAITLCGIVGLSILSS